MAHQVKIAYGLLMIGLLVLLCLAFSPGVAYARYNASTTWNTVVNTPVGQPITAPASPILTAKTKTLEFTLSEDLHAYDLQCSIQILSADCSYTDCTSDSLSADWSGSTVTVQMGDSLPPAGTYRLMITWKTEETDAVQTETATFFINYSDV